LNPPDLKRVSVLDHPFQFLAFFHLQCRSQGSRTDEVVLAVFCAPPDHLAVGEVKHVAKTATLLVNSKGLFHSSSPTAAGKTGGAHKIHHTGQSRERKSVYSMIIIAA